MDSKNAQKNQRCLGDVGNDKKSPPPQSSYASFIRAWQTIRAAFRKYGAGNVSFVWNPGSYQQNSRNDPHSFYPNPADVDWIGIDTYQRKLTQTFAADFKTFYTDFSGYGKPLIVGENGSLNFQGAFDPQQVYLQGLFTSVLANAYPQLHAYCYFDVDAKSGKNYTLGAGGLSELTLMATSPLFSP